MAPENFQGPCQDVCPLVLLLAHPARARASLAFYSKRTMDHVTADDPKTAEATTSKLASLKSW